MSWSRASRSRNSTSTFRPIGATADVLPEPLARGQRRAVVGCAAQVVFHWNPALPDQSAKRAAPGDERAALRMSSTRSSAARRPRPESTRSARSTPRDTTAGRRRRRRHGRRAASARGRSAARTRRASARRRCGRRRGRARHGRRPARPSSSPSRPARRSTPRASARASRGRSGSRADRTRRPASRGAGRRGVGSRPEDAVGPIVAGAGGVGAGHWDLRLFTQPVVIAFADVRTSTWCHSPSVFTTETTAPFSSSVMTRQVTRRAAVRRRDRRGDDDAAVRLGGRRDGQAASRLGADGGCGRDARGHRGDEAQRQHEAWNRHGGHSRPASTRAKARSRAPGRGPGVMNVCNSREVAGRTAPSPAGAFRLRPRGAGERLRRERAPRASGRPWRNSGRAAERPRTASRSNCVPAKRHSTARASDAGRPAR